MTDAYRAYQIGVGRFAGRWIAAEWSDRQHQWQSNNLPPRLAGQGYLYSCAGSLGALADQGIRTYTTRASARRGMARASAK